MAESNNPALRLWIGGLPQAQQSAARSVIGLIEGLPLDKDHEDDRRILFRSGVIAFERLRLKEASHRLENLKTLDPDHLLPLLVTQDSYESSLYGDIVRSRVQAIRQFKNLTDDKAKEVVLQRHLFDHLWLLDTSWERASGSEVIEQNLKRDFPKLFADELSERERKGRIDIKYRKSAGVHIVVELKKYERVLKLEELEDQGKSYLSALAKLLKNSNQPNPKIEIVFVLGKRPVSPLDGIVSDHIEKSLALWGARVVYYDELIENALSAYGEYLKAHEKVDAVERVIVALGGQASETPPSPALSKDWAKNRKDASKATNKAAKTRTTAKKPAAKKPAATNGKKAASKSKGSRPTKRTPPLTVRTAKPKSTSRSSRKKDR